MVKHVRIMSGDKQNGVCCLAKVGRGEARAKLRRAFTQSRPRLAAPAHNLTAVAISAMSILYQQWEGMCTSLGYIVSALGQKMCPLVI